jgi:hypothetical protein
LRIGVAIDSTLQRLGTTNKLLPGLEVVRIVGLNKHLSAASLALRNQQCDSGSYKFGFELSQLGVLLLGTSIVVVRHAGKHSR